MIFTYAIFIPNNWRRAAKLIVPMALAPMAVPWILGLVHPELYQVAIRAASLEKISEDGLFLLLGAFTAIFGTHTINTLRIEAYEARLLNQYRLGRRLGGGGMGEVYLAEHQLLKRPCAIKLIRSDLAGNPARVRPLRARGPRDRPAVALEHHRDLRLRPQRRRRVLLRHGVSARPEPGRTGRAIRADAAGASDLPAAAGVRCAARGARVRADPPRHQAGQPHGRLSRRPARRHQAAGFRPGQNPAEDESVHLSQEGTVAGSPLYMAPEQIMHDQPPDRRTDIYGLGAVAYFMLTGRPPFLGETAMAVMVAHARDPVTPPSQLRPEIPADLEAVVLRCLAKNPDDRYPDTPSLAEALGRLRRRRELVARARRRLVAVRPGQCPGHRVATQPNPRIPARRPRSASRESARFSSSSRTRFRG